MDTRTAGWRGYWVAAPTPFRANGDLDEGALRGLLRLYITQGVHGILLNGTTGEWFAQTPDERRRVVEIGADEVGEAAPVLAGCSSYTPSETISLAKHAESVRVSGVCVTPPPYAHPTASEVIEFFRIVSSAVDIPWVIYNWPRGTAIDLDVETMQQLADLDRVGAIKESTSDEVKCLVACEALASKVAFFGRFLHRRGLAMYREFGGAGNIDGGGLGASFAVPCFEALWMGDLDTARFYSDLYTSLASRLVRADYSGRFGSPTAQLKAAMRLLGQPGGFVRPPLMDINDQSTLEGLRSTLKSVGLEPAARR